MPEVIFFVCNMNVDRTKSSPHINARGAGFFPVYCFFLNAKPRTAMAIIPSEELQPPPPPELALLPPEPVSLTFTVYDFDALA